MEKDIKQAISRGQSRREATFLFLLYLRNHKFLAQLLKFYLSITCVRENSEPNFNIPLASEPEKHTQTQALENNKIDIMCAKTGQQSVKNLNLFTQNLDNHFNMFLNRLEEVNKVEPNPVTDAETSKHSCSKAIADDGDT